MKNVTLAALLLFALFCAVVKAVLPERLTDEAMNSIVGTEMEQADCLESGGKCLEEHYPSATMGNSACPAGMSKGSICSTAKDIDGNVLPSSWCRDAKEEFTCQHNPGWFNWRDCEELLGYSCRKVFRTCIDMGGSLVCAGITPSGSEAGCGTIQQCNRWTR